MTLLDTHAWIWWVNDPTQLSEGAKEAVDEAAAENSVYVSSISAWEVAMLVSKGRLKLKVDAATWVSYSEALSYLTFVPVNNRIAINSIALSLHPDPADRLIVATALHLGSSIVTKDSKIAAYSGVKTVW